MRILDSNVIIDRLLEGLFRYRIRKGCLPKAIIIPYNHLRLGIPHGKNKIVHEGTILGVEMYSYNVTNVCYVK